MTFRIQKKLNIPEENYVYFHHTNTKIIIPVDPDAISDSMGASFAQNTPLSRSAPIFSYQNSGPRTVSVNFTLHRDICNEYNNLGYDCVDALIMNLDQMVLPDYNSAGKIVNPPVVSLKLRDDIFIKGIVNQCSHTFQLPIIEYFGKNKYAVVGINFGITEVTPYSASILPNIGQYRNGSGWTASSGVQSGFVASAGSNSVTNNSTGTSSAIVGGGASGIMRAMTR